MHPTHPNPPPPDDPAARLDQLLQTGKLIPFHLDLPDKEYPQIKLSIYGAAATNELFVKLTNGTVTFVEAVDSPLLSPGMADRIFGMDVADSEVAFARAEKMWEQHRAELVAR